MSGRYEYKLEYCIEQWELGRSIDRWTAHLNKMDSEGWEFCGGFIEMRPNVEQQGHFIVFRRPRS